MKDAGDFLRQRVSERLRELKRNPFEAARIGGLERSFVNDIVIGKKKSVRDNNLWKLALALDATPSFFLANPEIAANRTAAVMGQIGAGAEITPELEQVPEDGLFEIEAAVVLPSDAIGFEVVGTSMWPRYDPGDVVICLRMGMSPENIPDGEEAAVRTGDGHRYLKRVLRTGKEGVFNLESHNAAAPIRNVTLSWASDVWTIVRASKWRRLTEADRSRLVNRTARVKQMSPR